MLGTVWLCMVCTFGFYNTDAHVLETWQNHFLMYVMWEQYDDTEVSATEVQETGQEYDSNYDFDYDVACEDIYETLDIDSLDIALQKNDIEKSVKFSDIVRALEQGEMGDVIKKLGEMLWSGIINELEENKTFMIQLISIALLGSIFVNISGSFGSGFVGENGFYVTYLIMTSLMLSSFSLALDMVCASLERVLTLIRIVVPVYALAMSYVGHSATSAGMYEIILVGVWLVQVLIIRFVIPMIKFYVIVSLVNNLNKEDSFSKLCQLIRNLVSWMLKTIIVFIAGLNIIKSLLEPQIDAIGRTTVNRVISSIPGGGIMSVLTGTFLGAGLVIKNCIGIAGILIIALIVLVPVVKTFLLMVMVKLTGAIIQPVGEKRYVDGVEALSGGMSLLLQTIGSSVVLFMLTIAIMAYASNGGG